MQDWGTIKLKRRMGLAMSPLTHNPRNVDPYISSVKFLGHFDGSDASTTFTDSSSSAHAITANGNAQLDTAQFKFGSASLLLDGTDDYAKCVDSADFNMQTAGDWTVEAWIRPNTVTGVHAILHFNHELSATNRGLHVYTNGTAVNVDNGVTASGLSGGTVSTGVWYHVAVTRLSGTIYVWLDGTQIDTEAAQDYGDGDSVLLIGRHSESTDGLYFNGWIDDVRVTKGVARYTANFTRPSEPFPNP
jgi:hypothetical protein